MGDQLDQLESFLRTAPLTDDQRRELWDVFTSSPDVNALESRLGSLNVPDQVKGALWDMRASEGIERPNDPQTGEPVRVPTDPGFVPFGDEPSTERGATAGSVLRNAAGGFVDVMNPLNILSGLYTAATRPGETLSGLFDAQVGQGREAIANFGEAADWLGRDDVPMSTRLKNAAMDASEGVGHGIATAVPLLGPQVADIGERIGSGDPNTMARAAGEAVAIGGGPAILRGAASRVQPALRRGAENLAARTMRAGDDVLAQTDLPVTVDPAARAAATRQLAATALDEGVLPGIVQNSRTRPRARMEQLLQQARNTLAGPAGRARVDPNAVRGPSYDALVAGMKRQSDWADDVRQAGEVADNAADVTRLGRTPTTPATPGASVVDPWDTVNAQSGRGAAGAAASTGAATPGVPTARILPTARAMNEQATGNVSAVRGRPGARADAARATARDARREVGRAVPETAPIMERINRLEPVAEAYERYALGQAVDIPGLPTIGARLALAGANRLVGPTARGLNRASKVSQSTITNAARAAAIMELLDRAATPAPVASH